MDNRDPELISAYLDGQITNTESARLESRLASDPELSAVLADIRAARGILRKLPSRRSPRNFTLTRKMVGLNPPLPRAYSFFQFATALASVLLVLTFAANLLAPRLSYVGQINGGYGGAEPIMPLSAPAATEAPAMAAATEAAAMEMLPLSTATAPAGEDAIREVPTADAQMGKESGAENSAPQSQPEVKNAALISAGWQIVFLLIALISAAAMFVLRQFVKRKWQ